MHACVTKTKTNLKQQINKCQLLTETILWMFTVYTSPTGKWQPIPSKQRINYSIVHHINNNLQNTHNGDVTMRLYYTIWWWRRWSINGTSMRTTRRARRRSSDADALGFRRSSRLRAWSLEGAERRSRHDNFFGDEGTSRWRAARLRACAHYWLRRHSQWHGGCPCVAAWACLLLLNNLSVLKRVSF